MKTFFNIDDLRKVFKSLNITHLDIFSADTDLKLLEEFSKQKLQSVSENISLSFINRTNTLLKFDDVETFSLYAGIKVINEFFESEFNDIDKYLYLLNNKNLNRPFLNSSTMLTNFGVITPYMLACSFISKIKGNIIFQSKDCIVTKEENCYHVLCYHLKSLEMYQTLQENKDFDIENYSFFTNSYPSAKFNLNFKDINKKVKQSTYTVTADSGAILNEWIKLGEIEDLSSDLIHYLHSSTKPNLNIKFPPFSSAPVVTVNLPPLSFAYVEIKL